MASAMKHNWALAPRFRRGWFGFKSVSFRQACMDGLGCARTPAGAAERLPSDRCHCAQKRKVAVSRFGSGHEPTGACIPNGSELKAHNETIPHAAFHGQTPDEMYFGNGDAVVIDLAAARVRARQERMKANRMAACRVCAGDPEFSALQLRRAGSSRS